MLQAALVEKNLAASAGDKRDVGSIPKSGRSPGGGCSIPLQYSCWRIPRVGEPGGHSPWGLKELDTAKATYVYMHTHT